MLTSNYANRPLDGVPPPEQKVTSLENAPAKSLTLNNLSLTEQASPQRPDFGTRGRPVNLWTNFVNLSIKTHLVLHVYRVEVEPKATGKKLLRILKLFLDGPDGAPLKKEVATDFKSTLVSFVDDIGGNFKVQYRSEEEDEPDPRAPTYDVRLQYTSRLPVLDFLSSLDPTKPMGNYDKGPIIQTLNIVLSYGISSNPGLCLDSSTRLPRKTELLQARQSLEGTQG